MLQQDNNNNILIFMKMNEALTSEKDYFKKQDEFNQQVMEFAEENHTMIYNGFDFLKVNPKNTAEWTYELHKKLCNRFGVKLIRAEHAIIYQSGHNPVDKISFIYVDEEDTNHEELNFKEVKL